MNSAGRSESDISGFIANPYAWLDFGEGHAVPVQIPDGFPPPIADRIFLLSRRGKFLGTPDLLGSLANNAELRIVWDEMFKRRRVNYKQTDAFLHPVSMAPKKLLALHLDLFEFYIEELHRQGSRGKMRS